MPRRDVWVLLMHGLPTVGLLLQGLLYLTTPVFMPYHGVALGVTWTELSAQQQGFILGVIRGMGAGSFSVSLAILLLLAIPFRRGEKWAFWCTPLIGIVFTSLTAYAAYTIDVRTPASPPWRATCGLTALYAAGAVFSLWPRSRAEKTAA